MADVIAIEADVIAYHILNGRCYAIILWQMLLPHVLHVAA